MWFDEAGEVVEMFRNSFPLSLIFFVPILIIISPGPAAAAHEFAVYRMQQYDLQGSSYGCRNALVNVEARPIEAQMLTRRCVVTKLKELTLDKFRDVVSQNAGALLVLLPQNLSYLSPEDREVNHLLELEHDMLQEETQIPVYFTHATEEIEDIYNDIKSSSNSDAAESATEALLSAASANGFQMVVTGQQSKALNDFQIVNIQGKLTGFGIEEQLPTVAVVAHYDAYGVAPSLARGADSNGSGVALLLEIARLFSKLYTNSRTHAKYNLLFLLSGAGKFNYQGTKRWIEDQLDTTESSLLADVAFVLCLDTVGSSRKLNLHVSKPPKEGSTGDEFYQSLKKVSETFFSGDVELGMVHKKINLAEDVLAWEHERFSIRRLPAFTLSHLESHRPLARQSIVDTRDSVDSRVLARNTKIVSEALARHIFNLTAESSSEIFAEGLQVEEGLLSAWLDYLSSQPRSAQLLDKDHDVVNTLEQTLARYLKDVRKILVKADKRDPDFVFYNGAEYTMNAYNVKPAVFDLFLALGIAAYLATVYLIAYNFSTMYSGFRRVFGPIKVKQQ